MTNIEETFPRPNYAGELLIQGLLIEPALLQVSQEVREKIPTKTKRRVEELCEKVDFRTQILRHRGIRIATSDFIEEAGTRLFNQLEKSEIDALESEGRKTYGSPIALDTYRFFLGAYATYFLECNNDIVRSPKLGVWVQ